MSQRTDTSISNYTAEQFKSIVTAFYRDISGDPGKADKAIEIAERRHREHGDRQLSYREVLGSLAKKYKKSPEAVWIQAQRAESGSAAAKPTAAPRIFTCPVAAVKSRPAPNTGFAEARFRQQVDTALGVVQRVLDINRNPTYAEDTPHTYDDKFLLTEHIVGSGLAAELNCLAFLGVTNTALETMRGWTSAGRPVSLRLWAKETCTFGETQVTNKESARQYVEETTQNDETTSTTTHKVVTQITQHLWDITIEYKISAFAGTEADGFESMDIRHHTRTCRVRTNGEAKVAPMPEVHVHKPVDCSLTWLLQHLDGDLKCQFKIDRSQSSCRTPRRNCETDAAMGWFDHFASWCSATRVFLRERIVNKRDETLRETGTAIDIGATETSDLFIPVVPLFEQRHATENQSDAEISSAASETPLLPVQDVNALLLEQQASLQRKRQKLAEVFHNENYMVTMDEAVLLTGCQHACAIAQQTADGLNYVEHMLRQQVLAAIGKIFSARDFADFMQFHEKRLFKAQYVPHSFCYSIRRPQHYPEGTLSIENSAGDPVSTIVRHIPGGAPISFDINAATRISFAGERYLHAMLCTTFAGIGTHDTGLSLTARARQFSSFVLLVGKMGGADKFEAKHGVIIRNKDELKIPLLMEQIAAPQEFRDAIESLSAEQQRFCKAIRAMQLEGSIIGVCVIQLKPQLEKLLNLPSESLTKEIKLTEDLLKLFAEYQIPSDLVTYEGPDDTDVATKLEFVRQHVAALTSMISDEHATEVSYEETRATAAAYRQNRLPATERVAGGFGGFGGFGAATGTVGAAASGIGAATGGFGKAASFTFGATCSEPSFGLGAGAPVRANGSSFDSILMATQTGSHGFGGGASGSSSSGSSSTVPAFSFTGQSNTPPAAGATQQSAATEQQPATPPFPTDTVYTQNIQSENADEEETTENEDFTRIPGQLDAKYESVDAAEAILRPTTIKTGDEWVQREQKTLLSTPCTRQVDRAQAKNQCFDLLDALSRSGTLLVEQSTLHVIVAATHCFAKSLMDTVVVDNVNPIEKLDRSTLLIASTIHKVEAHELVNPRHEGAVHLMSSFIPTNIEDEAEL